MRLMCFKAGKGRVISVVGFLLSLLGLLLFCPVGASATNGEYWSWTDAPAVVASSTDTFEANSSCNGSIQMKEVSGEPSPLKLCVSAGKIIRFGHLMSYTDNYKPSVGFASDTKMYRLYGICVAYDECTYLPASDTLIYRPEQTRPSRNLIVYKNFSTRLIPTVEFGLISELRYYFNSSNPDYEFKDPSGTFVPIVKTGASNNGKWLAVEYYRGGVGLLNLETFQMKRVIYSGYLYDAGYNPTFNLAVSNDGRHVAMMGGNLFPAFYDVDDTCGTDYETYPQQPTCKRVNIDYEAIIHRIYEGYSPRYSDDGGELSFRAVSYLGNSKNVVLRAAGYSGDFLDYIALGDSYTSGEGETDDSYYINGTNDKYEKCHLSTRSYPYLLASLASINPGKMRSVACSGAKVIDILGDSSDYWGQEGRLSINGERSEIEDTQRLIMQSESVHSFMPGRELQMKFIEKYKPKSITVSIGGNDVGFMSVLRSCVGPGTCSVVTDTAAREAMAVEIKGLFSKLTQLYAEIHAKSPDSKIYAIGYPKVINPNGTCNETSGLLLNSDERRFMDEGIAYLNEVVAAAANSSGVKYIDIGDGFGDNGLCGSTKPAAMNGVRLGDDDTLIGEADWLKMIGQESFHPNPYGHNLIATKIYNSVGNILNYNNCPDGRVACPTYTAAPDPTNYSYWIQGGYHDYPKQQNSNFIANKNICVDGKLCNLVLPNLSLFAGSPVKVEIHSTPQLLGEYTAASDGSFNTTINFPTDLEDGYHTIHIYGTSPSGESIDLYQTVKYVKYVAPPIEPVVDDVILVNEPAAPIADENSGLNQDLTEPAVKNQEPNKSLIGTTTKTGVTRSSELFADNYLATSIKQYDDRNDDQPSPSSDDISNEGLLATTGNDSIQEKATNIDTSATKSTDDNNSISWLVGVYTIVVLICVFVIFRK